MLRAVNYRQQVLSLDKKPAARRGRYSKRRAASTTIFTASLSNLRVFMRNTIPVRRPAPGANPAALKAMLERSAERFRTAMQQGDYARIVLRIKTLRFH